MSRKRRIRSQTAKNRTMNAMNQMTDVRSKVIGQKNKKREKQEARKNETKTKIYFQLKGMGVGGSTMSEVARWSTRSPRYYYFGAALVKLWRWLSLCYTVFTELSGGCRGSTPFQT